VTLSAIAGVFVSLKNRGRYYFLVILMASLSLLFLQYKYRYLSGQGLFGIVLLAGVALDYIWSRIYSPRKKIIFLICIVLLFFFFSPSIFISRGAVKFRFFNSSVLNLLLPQNKSYRRANAYSIYHPSLYAELADIIKKKSNQDAIIYSNYEYFLGCLSVLTGRATSSAMLAEIKPWQAFDYIKAADMIVWAKDPQALKQEPKNVLRAYELTKIGETELAFIYQNQRPFPLERRRISRCRIPEWALYLFLLSSLVLIFYEIGPKRHYFKA